VDSITINPANNSSKKTVTNSNPQTIIWTRNYPPQIILNQQTLGFWYRTFMFKHTKNLHHYSVFQNTVDLNYPHIQGYYILCYTTYCEDVKHNYTYNDLILVVENMNHGAIDDNGGKNSNAHYFLLRTFPLKNSLKDSMTNLFNRMNYILKYGEFPPETNVTSRMPLQRWGKSQQRAYSTDTCLVTSLPSINTRFNLENIRDEVVNKVHLLFLEYYGIANTTEQNSNVLELTSTISSVSSLLGKRKIVEVDESVFLETDIKSKLFDSIFPNFLSFLNNKNHNHKEYKKSIKEKLQMFYNQNETKIKDNTNLDSTLKNAVIDLTAEDEEYTIPKKKNVNEENYSTPPIKGRRNPKNITNFFHK